MMSKTDYEMVAKVMSNLREESLSSPDIHLATLLRVCADLAGVFRDQNSRFNTGMFLRACMPPNMGPDITHD